MALLVGDGTSNEAADEWPRGARSSSREQRRQERAQGGKSCWLHVHCRRETVRASAMSMTKRDTLYSGFTERVRRALPREWKDPKEPYSFSYPVETRIPARREAHSTREAKASPVRRWPRSSSSRRFRAGARLPLSLPSPIRQPLRSYPARTEYGKWINATANTSDIADTIHVDVMCRANSNPHMCSCMAPSIRPMATKQAIR